MPRLSAPTRSNRPLSASQVVWFRLQRHHLLDSETSNLLTICRDICGVQAQLMSAAELALWARNHSITRAEIDDTLWQQRRLVKTSLMRQTLHLIPADEFSLYISALRSSRVSAVLRVMSRFGITPQEADTLTNTIVEALASGPAGRSALAAAVRPKASKRVRAWMEKVWSIVRIPIAEGLICYGPEQGNEVNFIRTDQWLAKRKPMVERSAQAVVLRKYLRAYGPATLSDFSHWSGIPMKDVKVIWELVQDGLAEVSVEGDKCFLLTEDLKLLQQSSGKDIVKLLPGFDPYLLAHVEKDHLVETRHYKRVYRNQGWISPVVLYNGKIAGTWSHKLHGGEMTLKIHAFEPFSRSVRNLVEQEAASLAAFFNTEAKVVCGV